MINKKITIIFGNTYCNYEEVFKRVTSDNCLQLPKPSISENGSLDKLKITNQQRINFCREINIKTASFTLSLDQYYIKFWASQKKPVLDKFLLPADQLHTHAHTHSVKYDLQ